MNTLIKIAVIVSSSALALTLALIAFGKSKKSAPKLGKGMC